MNFFRHRLCWLLRIALIAMLGLALVPTLSRLMTPSVGSGPWSEICSTAGARWLAQTAAPSDAPESAPTPLGQTRSAHMDHCPLCSLGATVLGLPPAPTTKLPLAAGADHLPALYSQAPRPLYAWAAVQARAPPTL
ncbi:MAG: hypothetical protein CFE40_11725 [Burkholderiales bacterium PBB1]|nr:MAG: hypothetical protein CFE40_11725 [Burkholderiales bacterium PBB1]